jgi:predicted nucleic acid-binding Zn ribbon protein
MAPQSLAATAATRELRGIALYRDRGVEIEHEGRGIYTVPGCSEGTYTVDLAIFGGDESCSCPDHRSHPEYTCKHLIAATIFRAKVSGERRRSGSELRPFLFGGGSTATFTNLKEPRRRRGVANRSNPGRGSLSGLRSFLRESVTGIDSAPGGTVIIRNVFTLGRALEKTKGTKVSVTDNDSAQLETVSTRNKLSQLERRKVRFSLYDEAKRAAKACGECGTTLGADDTVFLAPVPVVAGRGWTAPVCEVCAPKRMVELRGRGERYGRRSDLYPEWQCATCGRSVVFRVSELQYRRRKHAFCSEKCSQIHHNRRRSERSQPSREKTCSVCGGAFTATRSDAKTCSPACKQKAYRQRRRTRVVHVKSGEPYDLYIGRASPRHGLKRSIWHNPYKIGEDGTREEILAKYEHYLLESQDLIDQLPELRGKVLACWCAPEPCHGDVLVRLVSRAE